MSRFTMALLVIVIALVTAAGCSRKEDDVLIRETIQEGIERAEAHQIGDLLKLATPDFIAQPGHHDQQRVKGVLFAAFRHYGQFQINYPRPVVEIDADGHQAQATVYFLIVSQSLELPGLKTLYNDPGQWLEKASEKADLYQLKLTWIKPDNHWQVKQAVLEGFKGVGF